MRRGCSLFLLITVFVVLVLIVLGKYLYEPPAPIISAVPDGEVVIKMQELNNEDGESLYVGKYEVTCADYCRFLNAVNYATNKAVASNVFMERMNQHARIDITARNVD